MYKSFYKSGNAILDNRKIFVPSSLVYEKNVHSIVIDNENNMKDQQNYTYGMPLQDDIFAYRYDSFLTGSRDADYGVKPYTEIPLSEEKPKQTNVNSNVNSNDSSAVCDIDSTTGVSVCGAGKQLYPILDPRFNLREAAKNCILLEDHLFQTQRQCHDCILKHLLMIEGFLEEGITLDKKKEYCEDLDGCMHEFRQIFEKMAGKMKNGGNLTNDECREFAQQIRKMRKPLCQKYATFF